MLDTAIDYGASEATLGEIGVASWRVVTKLPAAPALEDDLPAWVERQVRESLERLRIESVYAVLLHRPQQIFEPGGLKLVAALERVKAIGLTEKIGISIYAPEQIDPLLSRGRFDLLQAPFNILDRRLAAEGWMSKLKMLGIEVHVRSIFLQGLLLMQPAQRPAKFARWRANLGRMGPMAGSDISYADRSLRRLCRFAGRDRPNRRWSRQHSASSGNSCCQKHASAESSVLAGRP